MGTMIQSWLRDLLAMQKDAPSRPRPFRRRRALQDHPSKVRKGKDIRVKKQVFCDARLGRRHPILSFVDPGEFDGDILFVMLRDFDRKVVEADPYQGERTIDRSEDAHRKAKEPGIGDLIDESGQSEYLEARHLNRTPWPLVHSNSFMETRTKPRKPRYPVPQVRPNIFDHRVSEEHRQRRRLYHEEWAELNRTHDWPSWLVGDKNRLTVDILMSIFPNILTSDKDKREAAITFEAVNVHLRGHQPCEDSPLYGMKEKSVAKRVQRFLKDAKRYWELQHFIENAEAAYDQAEVRGLLSEAQDQLTANDDPDDSVVRLWMARLNE